MKHTAEPATGHTPTLVDTANLNQGAVSGTVTVNGHQVGKHSWLTLDVRQTLPVSPAPRGRLQAAVAFLAGRTQRPASTLLVQVEALGEHKLIARVSQPRRERNQLVELGLVAGTNPYITGLVHR